MAVGYRISVDQKSLNDMRKRLHPDLYRKGVADAGHWPADETVTVSGASISAPAGGASAADWS